MVFQPAHERDMVGLRALDSVLVFQRRLGKVFKKKRNIKFSQNTRKRFLITFQHVLDMGDLQALRTACRLEHVERLGLS